MGRRYEEPTVYRDKRCPKCGFYFTGRGLNGHLRFRHGEWERKEIKRLKTRLMTLACSLYRGNEDLMKNIIFPQLSEFSDASLDELRQLEDTLEYVKEANSQRH